MNVCQCIFMHASSIITSITRLSSAIMGVRWAHVLTNILIPFGRNWGNQKSTRDNSKGWVMVMRVVHRFYLLSYFLPSFLPYLLTYLLNTSLSWTHFSILFYSSLFDSILSFFYFFSLSILFYSILFYSVLFCSTLFYSISFYSILFCFILFYSILFYSILFYSIVYFFFSFNSILFFSISFYSILFFHFFFFFNSISILYLPFVPSTLYNDSALTYLFNFTERYSFFTSPL